MPYLRITVLVISFITSLLCSGFSQEDQNFESKASPQLISAFETTEFVPVIIYLKDQHRFTLKPSGTKKQKANFVFNKLNLKASETQHNLIEYMFNNNIVYRSFYIVNAIALKANVQIIRDLALFQEVSRISLDSPIEKPRSFTEIEHNSRADSVAEWGIQVIEADKVWEMGYDGENVIVGGQDTGYDWTHPAIKSKYRGYTDENNVDHNYNWHDAIHEIDLLHNDSIIDPSNNPCGLDVNYPCDDGSHGTHTMGTIVGSDGPNIIGVAPGAKWIGCRNMERGWGKPSTYIESFEWFLAPTDLNGENPNPEMAPHVINNSWSCPSIEGCDPGNWEFMDQAIENLKASGVVVVVSAGNNGNNCGRVNAPPSMFEASFAVGATKIIDTIDGKFIDGIAGYSSWGPVMIDSSFRLKPDISAPGSRVRSSTPGNNYSTSSGTSMAGPHVAGVVALLISAVPSLAGNVDKIEEYIQFSAEPMTKNDTCGDYNGNTIPNFIYGYGRINAKNAVSTALLDCSTENSKNNYPDVTIYPNPASDIVKIAWSGEENLAKLKIIDIQGRSFGFRFLSNNASLNISHLPEGVYIFKINIDKQIISKKFIKQK